jgi:hypothetical protein
MGRLSRLGAAAIFYLIVRRLPWFAARNETRQPVISAPVMTEQS